MKMVKEQESEKSTLIHVNLPQITTGSNLMKTKVLTNKPRKKHTKDMNEKINNGKDYMNKKPNKSSSKTFTTKKESSTLLELSRKFKNIRSSQDLPLKDENLVYQKNQIMPKRKLPQKLFPLDYWKHKRGVLSPSATQRGLQIISVNDTVIMRFRWSNYDRKDINTYLLDTN